MPDPVAPSLFSKPLIIGVSAVVAVIVIGIIALASWEIPAPKTHIEKVIPNDRLPR